MSTTTTGSQSLDAVIERMLNGATIAEAAGIDGRDIEAGYALAHSLYSARNYPGAESVFRALCLHDHMDERFWMGLAGCRQAAGDTAGAIDAYAFAAYAGSLGDPVPVLHGGLCHLKLGAVDIAKGMFEAASAMGAPENAAHAEARKKAQRLLASLTTEG